MRTFVRFVTTAVVLAASTTMLALPIAHADTNTIPPERMSYGVHICARAYFNHEYGTCLHGNPRMGLFRLARAKVTWGQHRNFTSLTTTLTVSRVDPEDDSVYEVGRTTVDSDLTADSYSWDLQTLFDETGAYGTGTYEVEIVNGTTLVGTTTVTFV